MNAPMSQCASRRILSLPVMMLLSMLLLLFAALLTGGIAFAGLQSGDTPSLPAQLNSPVQGTAMPLVTATPTCSPDWTIYPNPAPSGDSVLNGVTAIGPNDLWAVGTYTTTGTYTSTTLTVHSNGTSWTYVPSPNPPSNKTVLHAVAGVASNDVWAVGEYIGGQYNQWQTLAMHWNGTAWTIVPSANNIYNNYLYAVTAIAGNDVWAVGESGSSGFHLWPLIEHWDGSQWTVVSNPGAANLALYGVAATGANDVWAVGGWAIGGYPAYSYVFIEHWDGTAWTLVSTPNPNAGRLNAVTVVAANDVWAVGFLGTYGTGQTLTEHWDGTAWTIVPSPDPGATTNLLYGMSARASNDLWAVGDTNQVGGGVKTFALHWDGSGWFQVATPDNPTGRDQFYGVVATGAAGGAVWAVGTAGCTGGCTQNALIARWAPACLTPVPTQTPTATNMATATPAVTATHPPSNTSTRTPTRSATPVLPTLTSTAIPSIGTAVPPTFTPVATVTAAGTSTSIIASPTPTVCTISFSDVPPGSTFYSYIRCLACLGIVAGYEDSTFRPGNSITRGQIAKIVSNAANFQEPIPADRQTYQDVPTSNAFWLGIERLTVHGAIGGHACGGPGEPCVPPLNRPYFRPYSNATRTQLSKIIAIAHGGFPPPVGQMFEDVPPTNIFYQWTEQLAEAGVIGGYHCGGEGEPCIPSENRPYFRPYNSATRGQASKIVANAFFPNCQTPVSR